MINEKYYLVVIECGHVGTGRSLEVARYFKDFNPINAYICASIMPRSKKKCNSVKLIKEISYEEYLIGKQLENENLYLNTFKGGNVLCI